MHLQNRSVSGCFSVEEMGPTYFDNFDVQAKTIFFVRQEFLYIFTLITLKLNHIAHVLTVNDGAIAGYKDLSAISLWWQGCMIVPNFFLMTLRILF
jgi:hypothetical protein